MSKKKIKEFTPVNLMTKKQPNGYYGIDCPCGKSSFVIDKVVAKGLAWLQGIKQTCPKCQGTFELHLPIESNEGINN